MAFLLGLFSCNSRQPPSSKIGEEKKKPAYISHNWHLNFLTRKLFHFDSSWTSAGFWWLDVHAPLHHLPQNEKENKWAASRKGAGLKIIPSPWVPYTSGFQRKKVDKRVHATLCGKTPLDITRQVPRFSRMRHEKWKWMIFFCFVFATAGINELKTVVLAKRSVSTAKRKHSDSKQFLRVGQEKETQDGHPLHSGQLQSSQNVLYGRRCSFVQLRVLIYSTNQLMLSLAQRHGHKEKLNVSQTEQRNSNNLHQTDAQPAKCSAYIFGPTWKVSENLERTQLVHFLDHQSGF